MKLAIVGYRGFTDWAKFIGHVDEYVLQKGEWPILVISGGAEGADKMAERWAKIHSIPTEILAPDWKKHKKWAGFSRNTDIVNACTDMIAFPSKAHGKGTQDSIKKARQAGKFIKIVEV